MLYQTSLIETPAGAGWRAVELHRNSVTVVAFRVQDAAAFGPTRFSATAFDQNKNVRSVWLGFARAALGCIPMDNCARRQYFVGHAGLVAKKAILVDVRYAE